jgi:hypothetical protein
VDVGLVAFAVLPTAADPSDELLDAGEAKFAVPSKDDWSASADVIASRDRFGTLPYLTAVTQKMIV